MKVINSRVLSDVQKGKILPIYSIARFSLNFINTLCETDPKEPNWIVTQADIDAYWQAKNGLGITSDNAAEYEYSVSYRK